MKLLSPARVSLYLITLLILVNLNVFGVPPAVYWSNKTDWEDRNDSRYHEQVVKKYESEIDSFEWGEIFKDLADDFKETNVDWSDKLEIKQKFQNELDSLVNDYMEAAEWAGVENGKRDDKILKKFKSVPLFWSKFSSTL